MMKLKASLALALTVAAVAGCTANVSGSVTPNGAASTAPTTGGTAGTGATIGGTGSGATVELDGDLVAMYKVGRKWTYDMINAGPVNSTNEMSWEVLKVENGEATLKTTITGGPTGTVTSENKVKLNKGTNPEALFTATYQADGDVTRAAEAITVKAGSYPNAQKVNFKGKANSSTTSGSTTASSNLNNEVTFWWDKSVGLLKQITVTKLSNSVASGYQLNQTIPSIPGMPTSGIPTGGVNLNADITTTIELKAVTP